MNSRELILLIVGTVYVWIIYSCVSISGAYLASNDSINVLNILYWMIILRNAGNLTMLLFVQRPSHIKFNRESFTITFIPCLSAIGWFCYFRLVKFGELSIISPLISLYILIPIIIATIARKKNLLN